MIALISTYELGRQPFGLASPAAWLMRAGLDVTCHDLSRQSSMGHLKQEGVGINQICAADAAIHV